MRLITQASDVDDKILEKAEDISDSYYADGPVDWEDFINYMERGTELDFGLSMDSPAIRKIQRHIREHRRQYL